VRSDVIAREADLHCERQSRQKAEQRLESVTQDANLARKQLRDVMAQMDTLGSVSNQISARLAQFARASPRFGQVCNSLQLLISRFCLWEFSDRGLDELLASLGDLKGEVHIPRRVVERFDRAVTQKFGEIQQRIRPIERRCSFLTQKVEHVAQRVGQLVAALREKDDELAEFMENDLAPKLASLQAQMRKMQPRQQQPGNMTPPRVHWQGPRTGMASPTDVELNSGGGGGHRRWG
jgi:DNA repair ATPase RecN